MALFSKKNQPRTPRKQPLRRSPVTAYYRADSRVADKSPFDARQPKKNTRKFLLGFLDIILIAVLLIALAYSLMIKPQPKILSNNSAFHDEKTYQQAAADQFKRLGNRNKITFNEQALAIALQKRYPEITDVQVELPLFSEQPTIRLSIAKPSFILASRGQNYIINSSGVAVARAGELPHLKGLPLINDESGYSVNSGSQVLSASSVNFINNLAGQCQKANVRISSLTLPKIPQELDLRASDQPYYVKFYLGGDVLAESGQFLAARQHFGQASQPDQYLDVRVTGKVFYK